MAQNAKSSYMKEAISLLGATLPILAVNMAIYAAFFFAALLWFGFWLGLGLLLAKITEFAFFVCLIIALGAGGWGWRMARRYLLYLVKGAHIAAMTEIMLGRDVPKGMAQITYGRDIIKTYFKDVSILFAVDMLVKATVKALTGTVVRIANFLPLPQNARQLLNFVRTMINQSLSYVDEAILSYAIARREPNVWRSAVDGVILYGQSYKRILITTLKVWVVGKIFDIFLFAGLLLPMVLIASLFESGGILFFAFVLAFIGARLIELALYEPFALAYTMVTFHRETEGKEPDPEWKAKLEGMSSKFRELIGKADAFDKEAGHSGGLSAGDQVALPAGAMAGQTQPPPAQRDDSGF